MRPLGAGLWRVVELGFYAPIGGVSADADGVPVEVIPVRTPVSCVREVVSCVSSCSGVRPARVVARDLPDGVGVFVEPWLGLGEPGGVEEFVRWESSLRGRLPAQALRDVEVVLSGSEPAVPSGRAGVRLRVWGVLGDLLSGGVLPAEGMAVPVAREAVGALAGSPRVAEAAEGWLRLRGGSLEWSGLEAQVCDASVRALAAAPAEVWEVAFGLLSEWSDGPDVWVAASFVLAGCAVPEALA